MSSRFKHFWNDQHGGSMVEFALVAVFVFFPLMFGIIELGRMTFAKTTVVAAAREGVRYAIVHGSDNTTDVADETKVANYVKGRTALNGIVVTSTWTPNKKHPSIAKVTVSYNYVPVVRLLPSRTITSSSSQVIAY